MIGYRTILDIEYEGVNISTELNKDITSFSYEDNLDSADCISLTIIDIEKKWGNEWEPKKGDKIKITINTIEGNDKKKLDCGTFVVDEFDLFGPPDSVEIKATSLDISNKLKLEEKSRVWENTNLETIANDIASESELILVYDAKPISRIRVEQTEETDGSFLQKLCKEHGLCMKVLNFQLVIFSEKEYESNEAIEIQKALVKSYRFSNAEFSTCDKVIIEYFDPYLPGNIKVKEEIEREGYTKASKKVLRFSENFGAKGSKGDQEAYLQKVAKSKLREANKGEIKVSLELPGDINLVAGINIQLTGWGNRDLKYIIEKANHKLGGGYTTSLEARLVLDY